MPIALRARLLLDLKLETREAQHSNLNGVDDNMMQENHAALGSEVGNSIPTQSRQNQNLQTGM